MISFTVKNAKNLKKHHTSSQEHLNLTFDNTAIVVYLTIKLNYISVSNVGKCFARSALTKCTLEGNFYCMKNRNFKIKLRNFSVLNIRKTKLSFLKITRYYAFCVLVRKSVENKKICLIQRALQSLKTIFKILKVP